MRIFRLFSKPENDFDTAGPGFMTVYSPRVLPVAGLVTRMMRSVHTQPFAAGLTSIVTSTPPLVGAGLPFAHQMMLTAPSGARCVKGSVWDSE